MTILEALLMGVIQGVAEFLPISSSGHLAIFENILKINNGNIYALTTQHQYMKKYEK